MILLSVLFFHMIPQFLSQLSAASQWPWLVFSCVFLAIKNPVYFVFFLFSFSFISLIFALVSFLARFLSSFTLALSICTNFRYMVNCYTVRFRCWCCCCQTAFMLNAAYVAMLIMMIVMIMVMLIMIQPQSGTLAGMRRLQQRLLRLLGLTFGNLKCRFTAVARPVGIFLSVSDGIAKRSLTV